MAEDKNIILLEKDSKGYFSCDLTITKEQWLEILKNKSITTPSLMKVLLSFYFMPDHKGTCSQCAEEYKDTVNSYNTGISSFGRAVARYINGFEVQDETGNIRYWPIPIGRGREIKINGNNQFEWELRKELIEALQDIVIENAVSSYIIDFDKYWNDEKYKWRAVKWFQDHWDINASDFVKMLDEATSKSENLLSSQNSYPRGMILEMAKADTSAVKEMFIKLFDETESIEKRISDFIKRAEEIREKFNPGSWNVHYQTTNSVSVYLWLKYPDKYYIYKYGEYVEVDNKLGLGFSIKKNGKPEELKKGFEMYGLLNSILDGNQEIKDILSSHLSEDSSLYSDPKLKTATIDLGYFISRRYKSLKSSLYSKVGTKINPFISKAKTVLENKKNIILQGAPGTGKTYNTAALALSIIDGHVPEKHDEVMARYKQLSDEKRIGFTTFHQSMDYEDFIEGIKPFHSGENVSYKIENGIFKELCIAAKVASEVSASGTDNMLSELNDNPTIWKVSLEGTGDNATRRDCMENGYIRIGWSEYGDIDFTEDNPKVTEGKQILRTFQNDMKIGDIVVSCWSQTETDAIGIITGDYEYRSEGGDYPRYREVRWIVKGINHDITEINNGRKMTLGTVYRLSIQLNDILDVIKTYSPVHQSVIENIEKPFVLIIDEINRGNVSKIFGEIITLIEKDKRLGAEHPITVILPYSKQSDFGVPSNLYIIGTMNTTDRSTGTIDYALRRRFAFLTVPSEKGHILDETGKKLFDNVKEFIEKYRFADMDIDDLMVGHSYFMAEDEEELKLKMEYEIIPLLKEYIKDGILRVNKEEQNKYFDSWLNLDVVNDNDTGTSED